jgi:pyruvate dehydrogenase (quinone)
MPSHNLAADFLLARPKDWGVRRILHPGDGINGVIGALERTSGDFEFIQVAHEEVAALAACARAKFTGELGVCLATQGPGAIHLLNGLYDAKLDRQPVLANVGQPDRAALGSHFQQEVNLSALFQDVASAYLQTILDPEQVRHVVDCAVRIALAERAPTCLIFLHDVQRLEAVPEPPREHGCMPSSVGYSPPQFVPGEAELRHAAEILNGGRRVTLLVGSGAIGAAAEVREVAEVLGAGIAKALLGKTVLPPKPGQAAAVRIDGSARLVGLRYPTQVNLTGDAAATLRALLPLLETKRDRSWRERVASLVRDCWEEAERCAVAKYWREWPDQRFVVLVANNRDLNYVSWEQRVMEGFAKYPESQDLIEFPFARTAELLGLRAEQRRTLEAALARGDPDAEDVTQQLALQGITL